MFGQFAQLIGIVPVHPVAESHRLLGLPSGEPEDAAFAFVDEVVDAVFVDGGLCAEPQLLFDFDFDPQSLAVETVLVAQVVAGHGEESLVGVLVGAAPGVVNAHRVVGGDRPVEKAPALAARILSSQLLKCLLVPPELQNRVFAGNKIAVGDGLKHEIRGP